MMHKQAQNAREVRMTKNKPPRHLAPRRCPGCGGSMRLRWRVPDPHSQAHDLRQFTCSCGVQLGDKVAREPSQAEVA